MLMRGKGFFGSLFNKVLKPLYNGVIKPVYNDAIKPVLKPIATAGKEALGQFAGQTLGKYNSGLGRLAQRGVYAAGQQLGVSQRGLARRKVAKKRVVKRKVGVRRVRMVGMSGHSLML
jgi:hypothetical protein